MRNDMLELGKLIKVRRKLLGLLQPELASIAGTNTRTLQLIETGEANPSFKTLLKITEALGLEINFQVRGALAKSETNATH